MEDIRSQSAPLTLQTPCRCCPRGQPSFNRQRTTSSTSTSHRASLGWLVIAFPSASASPFRHASAQHLGPSFITPPPSPCSCVSVGCSTPFRASPSRQPLLRIAPLSFGWLLHFLAPQPLPLVVSAQRLGPPFITPPPFVTTISLRWLS